jgi:prophage regulatory protein
MRRQSRALRQGETSNPVRLKLESVPMFIENSPSFLRLPQVRERTGYSRATIYNLMAQGKFPRAVALGSRAVAWLDSEITEWINNRVSASRGQEQS